MRILICDDEPSSLKLLYIHVQEYMKSHFIGCDITATTNPVSVMESGERFDLAFLDIQMERVDGIALARELKRRNERLALFFVTSYDEYQDDAMDLQAFRFFAKPFDITRLYAGLDKAMEYIDGAYVDLFLNGGGGQQRVLVDDILYVTRENRRVTVRTKGGALAVKESFDELCGRLRASFFYQVHNSFFVNLHYVEAYSYSELTLTDGARIPIASRKQAEFRKFWFEYLRRR